MRTKLVQAVVLGAVFEIVSCGEATNDGPRSGGGKGGLSPTGGTTPATGGTAVTGDGGTSQAGDSATSLGATAAFGGSSSGKAGGTGAGGTATGGKAATGGATTGGAGTGGESASGGAASGGAGNAGAASGGEPAASGGRSAAGGAVTGGSATGGNSAVGGALTGGSSATAGAATGGLGTGGLGAGGTTTIDPCSATGVLTGGTTRCDENTSGPYGDYEWQLWSAATTGCLTTYSGAGAAFSASWEDSADFIARVGLRFDATRTHQEIGVVSADFAETKTGEAGTYSYIGVYGWMEEPEVEFYILDDAFDWPVELWGARTKAGVMQVDGGSYDVTHQRATGTRTFLQIYSVRQTSRQCGHISVSEQFSQWEAWGLELGKVTEVSLFVETGGGIGSIDFTSAKVSVD